MPGPDPNSQHASDDRLVVLGGQPGGRVEISDRKDRHPGSWLVDQRSRRDELARCNASLQKGVVLRDPRVLEHRLTVADGRATRVEQHEPGALSVGHEVSIGEPALHSARILTA